MALVGVSSKSISGFDPRSVIPGCSLWLDAADSSTLTLSGSNVIQWNDKSGNGNHALNGNTTVTYSSNSVTIAAGSSLSISKLVSSLVNTPFVYFVVEQNYTNLGSFLTDNSGQPGSTNALLAMGYRSSTDIMFQFYSNDLDITTGFSGYPYNTRIWAFTVNSSNNRSIRLNGTVLGSDGNTSGLSRFYSPSILGGTYYECILYIGTTYTTTQIQQVEGYLAGKWGLQSQFNKYFLPTTISGCKLWLDAYDINGNGTPTSNGATISTWVDKSGNSYNATAGTSPTYSNGVVSFVSASSQYMTIAQGFGNALVNSSFTIIIVGQRTVGTTYEYFLAGADANNNANLFLGYVDSTHIQEVVFGGTDYQVVVPAYSAGEGNAILSFDYSGSGTTVRTIARNGITSSTTSALSLTSFNTPYLGRRYNGAYTTYHDVGYSEFIAYVPAISTAQRQQVEGYLAKKWGLSTPNVTLSTTNPYYSIKPFSRVFQPSDIPGCQIWLDAADASTITLSGNKVSQWNDKSGYGNNATQTNSSYQPTYSNGVITFTESGTNGENPNVLVLPNGSIPYGNSAYSIFIAYVPKNTTSPNSDGRVLATGTIGTNTCTVCSYNGGSNMYLSWYGPDFLLGTSPMNSKVLYGAVYDQSTQYGYLNGVTTFSSNASGHAATNSPVTIGTAADYTKSAMMDLYEILVYNTAVTSTQRQQVEGYLSSKWGISLKPSTILSNPSSATGVVLWLDGTDPAGSGTPPTSGTKVSTWVNKGGSTSYNATQGTSGNQPSYISNAINGLGAILFNSSSPQTYFNHTDLYSNRSFSVYIVFKRQASGLAGFMSGSGGGGNNNMGIFITNYTCFQFWGNDLVFYNMYPYTGNTSTEPAYLIECIYTPGSRQFFINGSLVASDTNSANLTSDSGATIGSSLTGYIGDLVVLNGVPTTATRQQLEYYFSKKWNITMALPHPYTITPPTSSTFNPKTISGLGLWLDASDPNIGGSVPTNGSSVLTWYDKSGNNRNATGVNTPTYSSSNIVFNGSSYFNVNLDFLAGNSHFAFIVCSNTNYTNIYGATTGGNGSNSLHIGFRDSSSYRMNYWGNDWYQNFVNYQANKYNILGYFWNYNASKTIYANGSLEGSTSQAGTPGTMSGGGTIGNVVGQGVFQGNIQEILFYTSSSGSPVNTTNQQQIEGYLAWKWGLQGNLPSTHAYKKRPP